MSLIASKYGILIHAAMVYSELTSLPGMLGTAGKQRHRSSCRETVTVSHNSYTAVSLRWCGQWEVRGSGDRLKQQTTQDCKPA